MEESLTHTMKNDVDVTAQILRALKGIQYGHIQITVQDSRVVQIDKTEKVRLDGQGSLRQKGGNNG